MIVGLNLLALRNLILHQPDSVILSSDMLHLTLAPFDYLETLLLCSSLCKFNWFLACDYCF